MRETQAPWHIFDVLTEQDLLDRILPSVQVASRLDRKRFAAAFARIQPVLLKSIKASGVLEVLNPKPRELTHDARSLDDELSSRLGSWAKAPHFERWSFPEAANEQVVVERDHGRWWVYGTGGKSDLRAVATPRTLERIRASALVDLLEEIGRVASEAEGVRGDAFWHPVLAELNLVMLWDGPDENERGGLADPGALVVPARLQLAFARAYISADVGTEETEDLKGETKQVFQGFDELVGEFDDALNDHLRSPFINPGQWIEDAWNIWISEVGGETFDGTTTERFFRTIDEELGSILLIVDEGDTPAHLREVRFRRVEPTSADDVDLEFAVDAIDKKPPQGAIMLPRGDESEQHEQVAAFESLRRGVLAMPPALESARRLLGFAAGDLLDEPELCRGFDRNQSAAAVLAGARDFDVARKMARVGGLSPAVSAALSDLASKVRRHVWHCLEGQRELLDWKHARLATLRELQGERGPGRSP